MAGRKDVCGWALRPGLYFILGVCLNEFGCHVIFKRKRRNIFILYHRTPTTTFKSMFEEVLCFISIIHERRSIKFPPPSVFFSLSTTPDFFKKKSKVPSIPFPSIHLISSHLTTGIPLFFDGIKIRLFFHSVDCQRQSKRSKHKDAEFFNNKKKKSHKNVLRFPVPFVCVCVSGSGSKSTSF